MLEFWGVGEFCGYCHQAGDTPSVSQLSSSGPFNPQTFTQPARDGRKGGCRVVLCPSGGLLRFLPSRNWGGAEDECRCRSRLLPTISEGMFCTDSTAMVVLAGGPEEQLRGGLCPYPSLLSGF